MRGIMKIWTLPLLLLANFASSASAQCIQPDGLDGGPCCTAASPRYPTPPAFQQASMLICWQDCDVGGLSNLVANWGTTYATLGSCKNIQQTLTLTDAAGNVSWKGRLRLQYSRTWLETDLTGQNMQVWRYLVNGDLKSTAAAGGPCVPSCVGQFNNRAHWTGYVDLVRTCGSNSTQHAWMLTHSCDLLSHAPGFPRGGSFHPDKAFTIVGPAASFAPSPLTPKAAGGTSIGAVRRVASGGGLTGPVCEYEEPVDAGLNPLQDFCLCGTPAGAPQWAVSDLGLGSFCATSIFTPGGPYLPGYLSMSIGSWTDPATYPGLETVRLSAGGYDYVDPCSGTVLAEVFYGVTTLRGFQAFDITSAGPGMPLPLSFVDQANSLSNTGATQMNVRSKSSHILNLNFN